MNDKNQKQTNDLKYEKPEPKPNEQGGFYFSSHFKITDPESGEVFVQARGD